MKNIKKNAGLEGLKKTIQEIEENTLGVLKGGFKSIQDFMGYTGLGSNNSCFKLSLS